MHLSAAASLLALLLAGCAHRSSTAGGGGGQEVAPSRVMRLPLPGLVDVACPADGCVALTALGLIRVPSLTPLDVRPPAGATGLGVDAAGVWIAAPCAPPSTEACRWDVATGAATPLAPAPPATFLDDPPTVAEAVERFPAGWNAAMAQGWRLPFHHTLVGPGGVPLTLSRGAGGTGQLLRAGSPPAMVRVPVAESPASWPAPLALHPSGREVYLVSWPGSSVRAIDPQTLSTRWAVGLDAGGQGLFVDPTGRWLLVGEGPTQTDRLVDWPLPVYDPASPVDPARDEALRAQPRPPMDAAVLVDLATHAVVARAGGAYRRFATLPGSPARVLLATDRELVIYTPEDP